MPGLDPGNSPERRTCDEAGPLQDHLEGEKGRCLPKYFHAVPSSMLMFLHVFSYDFHVINPQVYFFQWMMMVSKGLVNPHVFMYIPRCSACLLRLTWPEESGVHIHLHREVVPGAHRWRTECGKGTFLVKVIQCKFMRTSTCLYTHNVNIYIYIYCSSLYIYIYDACV